MRGKLWLAVSVAGVLFAGGAGCASDVTAVNDEGNPVGYVEPVVIPGMDAANACVDSLGLATNEFVICYYRPDGNYAGWNLWLWNAAAAAGKRDFTGIANGVAYFRAPKSAFFNSATRSLGLIVRTDAWQKDPGPDMHLQIDAADRVLVVSGRATPYPVARDWPRILSANVLELGVANYHLRLKLSSRIVLSTGPGTNGFTIRGGLAVADACSYADRGNLAVRTHPFTDDVVLRFTGTISQASNYLVAHPSFSNAQPVDFSVLPDPAPELAPEVIAQLPVPVLDGHPRWVSLYWAAWRFMHEKITAGSVANGFAPSYIDEGFNENIYQWDSCFMVAYAMYGLDVFPAMATLDNFYNHQAADGYICRCYNEGTGQATGPNDINPTLFAWMEWRYHRLTGDTARLGAVLPKLDKYFGWVKTNARSAYGNGLYWITDLGSGMDNSPRESYVQKGAWIDISAQQALAALSLVRLATAAGDGTLAAKYQAEYDALKTLINGYLWHAGNQTYYDRRQDGSWHVRNTIASYWPLVAELADGGQAAGMIDGHLRNPAEFYRPHLFPTLAANDPLYDGDGHYWRGGVWAPTDFAVIKGLALHDPAFAHEAATNHVGHLARVYHDFDPATYHRAMPALDEPNIPRNGDGRNQIWEAYSPERAAPGTRWDATLLVRQKFCGWSGVGPVALLIEHVIGLDLDAPANTVTWDVRLLERHGLENFKFAGGAASLVVAARAAFTDAIVVTGTAPSAFRLVVKDRGSVRYDGTVPAGAVNLTVP